MEKEAFDIFAPQGPGRELEVFPFLRYFGNSTFKLLDRWAKWNLKVHNDIIEDRKVIKHIVPNIVCTLVPKF